MTKFEVVGDKVAFYFINSMIALLTIFSLWGMGSVCVELGKELLT